MLSALCKESSGSGYIDMYTNINSVKALFL